MSLPPKKSERFQVYKMFISQPSISRKVILVFGGRKISPQKVQKKSVHDKVTPDAFLDVRFRFPKVLGRYQQNPQVLQYIP